MSTLHRSRKEELIYRKYLKGSQSRKKLCSFCAFTSKDRQVLEEHTYFLTVKNIFPYTLWDSCKVTEHLMLVPKRHITSLNELKQKETGEYFSLTQKREADGYDVYSRGQSSNMKSIPHQHTHLIKTNNKKIKGLLYIESPLVNIVF